MIDRILLFVGVLFGCLIISSCEKELFNCLRSEGSVVQRAVSLEPFDRIEMVLSGTIILKEGPMQNVTIEATDNVIDRILSDSDVKNGEWQIDIDRCSNIDDVKIFVTVPDIKGVSLVGASALVSDGVFENVNQLDLEINGDGDIDLKIGTASSVRMGVNGSGDIRIQGVTALQHIEISGSARVHAIDLISKRCDIEISGDGKCNVHVTDELNIDFNGSGQICYLGNPKINQEVSGAGKVTSGGSCD